MFFLVEFVLSFVFAAATWTKEKRCDRVKDGLEKATGKGKEGSGVVPTFSHTLGAGHPYEPLNKNPTCRNFQLIICTLKWGFPLFRAPHPLPPGFHSFIRPNKPTMANNDNHPSNQQTVVMLCVKQCHGKHCRGKQPPG